MKKLLIMLGLVILLVGGVVVLGNELGVTPEQYTALMNEDYGRYVGLVNGIVGTPLANDENAITQNQLDNIAFSNNDLNPSWVVDKDKNKVVEVQGQRCVLYYTFDTYKKEFAREQFNDEDETIVEGDWTGDYLMVSSTRQITIPCYQLEEFSEERTNEILEDKKARDLSGIRGRIIEYQTKENYDLG